MPPVCCLSFGAGCQIPNPTGKPVYELPGSVRHEHDQRSRRKRCHPPAGHKNPARRPSLLTALRNSNQAPNRGPTTSSGENVMELRVHLKVCEACGCLWFRAQSETTVYCSTCHDRFKDFPTPQSRRRRGRPKKATLPTVFAVEAPHSSLPEDAFKSDTEFLPMAGNAGDRAAISLLAAQASHSRVAACVAGVL